MYKTISKFSIIALMIFNVLSAAVVSINFPQSWLTLRKQGLTVTAIIDTASTKNKPVIFTIYKNINGNKKNILTKKIKVGENIAEIDVKLPIKNIAGLSYVGIDWSVTGTKFLGSVAPVGVMVLPKVDTKENLILQAIKLDSEFSKSSFKKSVDINNSLIGFNWDQNNFIISILSNSTSKLSFNFDGKNGKNAFLSFADRKLIVNCDSIVFKASHINRIFNDSQISYKVAQWNNDIKIEKSGDIILINIPWYDLGIIPAKNRTFGISIFDSASKSAKYPLDANMQIPGSWGNIKLQ